MIDWLLFAIWLVGFLLCWRTASWILAHVMAGNNLEGIDIVFGLLFGGVISIFWPVIVPVRIAHTRGWLSASSEGIHHGFMRPPKSEREKILRREAFERELRIAELERQLEKM